MIAYNDLQECYDSIDPHNYENEFILGYSDEAAKVAVTKISKNNNGRIYTEGINDKYYGYRAYGYNYPMPERSHIYYHIKRIS